MRLAGLVVVGLVHTVVHTAENATPVNPRVTDDKQAYCKSSFYSAILTRANSSDADTTPGRAGGRCRCYRTGMLEGRWCLPGLLIIGAYG